VMSLMLVKWQNLLIIDTAKRLLMETLNKSTFLKNLLNKNFKKFSKNIQKILRIFKVPHIFHLLMEFQPTILLTIVGMVEEKKGL
jgi:hypothetical protein